MKYFRKQKNKKPPHRDTGYDIGLVLLGTIFGISGNLVANLFDRFLSHFALYDFLVSVQFALLVYVIVYYTEKSTNPAREGARTSLVAKEDILTRVRLVAEKVEKLVKNTLGRELPITYLTLFAHNTLEYDSLVEQAKELGEHTKANNGVGFLLYEPIQTAGGLVTHIRIRMPDPYRSQIGCADVAVENYERFTAEELHKYPENLRLIRRPEYKMIEFFDFENNDVLAYIMSNQKNSE